LRRQQNIAIAGAGLVGCMLAQLLVLRGHRVRIFEKRSAQQAMKSVDRRSTHLVISKRGWNALAAIGVADAVRSKSIPLRGRMIHGSDGTMTLQPYSAAGAVIDAITRSELNGILLSRCQNTPGLEIRFDSECVDADARNGSLTLQAGASGQLEKAEADWIFAADGARSSIRRQMLNREGFFYSQKYETFGYKELTIPSSDAAGFARDAMHAWPRGKCSLFAFPNHDGSFTATLLAPFAGEDSFEILRSRADAERLFQSRFADVSVLALAEDVISKPTSSLMTVNCHPWVFDGRLALVGDAAHAMVPFLGQGMNAGFEDCTTLMGLLDQHGEDFGAALAVYGAERKSNCDAITALSARAFTELTELIGDRKFHEMKKIELKLCELFPKAFVAPYELIAFTDTPYAQAAAKTEALEQMSKYIHARLGENETLHEPQDVPRIREIVRTFPGFIA
jgi:kynurenine 3-monooxygenase